MLPNNELYHTVSDIPDIIDQTMEQNDIPSVPPDTTEMTQEVVSDLRLVVKTLVEVETLLYFILGALIFAFFYKLIKSHTDYFV